MARKKVEVVKLQEGTLIGGIGAGEWCHIDPNLYGNSLKQNGLNFVIIEAMAPTFDPTSSSGFNNKPLSEVLTELVLWVNAIREYGITIGLHWVNGNDTTLTDSGRFSITEQKNLLKNFIAKCGVNNLILCPIAEENGSSVEKAWYEFCIDEWYTKNKGKLMYNGRGRPSAAPVYYTYIDYHIQSIDESVSHVILKQGQKLVIDTDSPVIRQLQGGQPEGYANPVNVERIAKHAAKNNACFNLYLYKSKVIDTNSFKAIYRAYTGEEYVDTSSVISTYKAKFVIENVDGMALLKNLILPVTSNITGTVTHFKRIAANKELRTLKITFNKTKHSLLDKELAKISNREFIVKSVTTISGFEYALVVEDTPKYLLTLTVPYSVSAIGTFLYEVKNNILIRSCNGKIKPTAG